jgi:hypothetical protein
MTAREEVRWKRFAPVKFFLTKKNWEKIGEI